MLPLNKREKLLHYVLNALNTITSQCELLEMEHQSGVRTRKIFDAAMLIAKMIRQDETSNESKPAVVNG